MAKKKAAPGAAAPSFEASLARLEEIVRELEQPDLPLERSLAVFEEGVRLSRQLHQRLDEAERRVEILVRNEAGEQVAAPFAPEGDAPAAAGAGAEDGDEDGDDDDDEGDAGADGGGQRALPF